MNARIALLLLLAACQSSTPRPPAPTVDAGRADAQRAEIAQAIEDSCQMCHSLDLVRSQRLSRSAWEKELKKMASWGAQVPPEQVAAMVALLSEQQGIDVPSPSPREVEAASAPAEVAADPTPVSGNAKAGAAVYQLACAACHGAGGAGGPVAPVLALRPVLYRPAEFEQVVRQGLRRMPAVAIDAVAIRDVLVFLRAQR